MDGSCGPLGLGAPGAPTLISRRGSSWGWAVPLCWGSHWAVGLSGPLFDWEESYGDWQGLRVPMGPAFSGGAYWI